MSFFFVHIFVEVSLLLSFDSPTGFYMPTTRSQEEKSMAISQKMSDYFEKLVEPLVTNKVLEEMFEKLKLEVFEKFEEKINNQNDVIQKLEDQVTFQQNTIDNLTIMVDNNEQYSRRSCLRIHGIGYSKDQEGRENVMDIVRKCYEEVDIPFDERNIDRAHRIGKTYREKDGDKTFKSIIVKFRSWNFNWNEVQCFVVLSGTKCFSIL